MVLLAKGTKLESSLADLIYIDSRETQCAIQRSCFIKKAE
jgi:hypothetical protein